MKFESSQRSQILVSADASTPSYFCMRKVTVETCLNMY